MEVRFIENDGTKPRSLLAEAEVHFDIEAELKGMKLVGFAVRRTENGGIYVTFPSRAFGAGDDRRYFDFLRAASDDHDTQRKTVIRFKSWIRDAYKNWEQDRATR